jgi:hypothetical protein
MKKEKVEEQLIEEVEEVEDDKEVIDRNNLNIQNFMNDMSLLGQQINNRDLVKPNFHFGDASVTNYLLWLLLGEVMMLNDNINKGDGE